MCLDHDEKLTENLKKSMKKGKKGKHVFYKTFRVESGKLKTTYKLVSVRSAGDLVSNRTKKELSYDERCYGVERGIHVFMSLNGARSDIDCGNGDIVVKVTARPEDLVAVGTFDDEDSEVFMKVNISKEEFDRALKAAEKDFE
jgi:NACalpha-BTF3-like transcription factor